MRAPYLVLLALTIVLAGCGGGGGGTDKPVAPIAPPIVPGSATFPLSFTVPGTPPTSTARAPQYVSPGTKSIAVYDGATLIYAGNYNAGTFTTVFATTGPTSVSASGTCPSNTCTVTITTTIGTHTFGVITYPVSQGTPPPFTGVILSENELTVTLLPGPNPGQTLSLLGVAYQAPITGPSPAPVHYGNPTGPLVGIIGTTYTYQYTINDSSNNQIILPGNYDNGPVTIAENDPNGTVTFTTPVSQSAPPATLGQQSFSVTCAKDATAPIVASAGTHPNAAYASGLIYNSTINYAPGTIGSTTLRCVPNSATLPILVN